VTGSRVAELVDPFDLRRFVDAQEGVYDEVIGELRSGRKRSHWIWFIFPQLGGLGSSEMSSRYAIASLEEARTYLAHPVLGPRLLECIGLVLDVPTTDAETILPPIDAKKLRSSMTMFRAAAADPQPFQAVLARFFGGEADPATIAILDAMN
jgi:uncharacterized protein (DUF1810 family)